MSLQPQSGKTEATSASQTQTPRVHATVNINPQCISNCSDIRARPRENLERLNSRDAAFEKKLDLSRIAVAGHSLGALSALLDAQIEPRFRAAILMDSFVPAALPSATKKPRSHAGRRPGPMGTHRVPPVEQPRRPAICGQLPWSRARCHGGLDLADLKLNRGRSHGSGQNDGCDSRLHRCVSRRAPSRYDA